MTGLASPTPEGASAVNTYVYKLAFRYRAGGWYQSDFQYC